MIKKLLILGATMLLTSAISIALFDYFTGEPYYPENVIQTKLYSNILGEEREIIIHLPRNCDSTKKYPVMYVLDGSSEDGHVANKFDILSTAGHTTNADHQDNARISAAIGIGRWSEYLKTK